MIRSIPIVLAALCAAAAHPEPTSAQHASPDVAPRATPDTAHDTSPDALRRARAFRPSGSYAITGTVRYRGNVVPLRLLVDGMTFAATFGGPLPYAVEFDGSTVRERERAPAPRVLHRAERDAALLANWMVTDGWLDARAPLSIDVADAGDRSGRVSVSIAVSESPTTGTVELDPRTGQVHRAAWHAGGVETSVTLSGHGGVDGAADWPLPARIVQTTAGSDPLVIELDRVRPTDEPIRQPMPEPGSGARFDPARPPDVEVRRAPTGHLLVRPLIDDLDAGWFILDTGAGATVISTSVAAAHQLEVVGEVTAIGVGGATRARYVRAGTFRLGPVTLHEATMVGIDLSFLEPHLGVPIAGVVGYDVLAQVVVEFDAAGPSVEIHDPAAYAASHAWEPLVVYHRQPCVHAAVDGHRGLFMLDTGADTNVTVYAHAVARHHLLDRPTAASRLGGVGGTIAARTGTLDTVELGGHRFQDVEAALLTESNGPTDRSVTGSIGGALLASFTLVIDASGQRIAFVRRSGDEDRPASIEE